MASRARSAASARPPLSIERQLPLLIWVLLLPIVLVLVFWVHRDVRRDLLAAAGGRMESSAREIGALFEASVSMRMRYLGRFAQLDSLRVFAADPTPAHEVLARADLVAMLRGQEGVAELWTPDGRLLAQEVHASTESAPELMAGLRDGRSPEQPGHQPLRMIGDRVVHEVAVAVHAVGPGSNAAGAGRGAEPAGAEPTPVRADDEAPTGPVVGHLVLRRFLAADQGSRMLARLIGSGGRFVLGNRDGGVWTDLAGRVAPPPVDPLDVTRRFFAAEDGAPRIGAGIAIDDSPWLLWVEGDAGGALARSQRLLVRMLVLGGLLILLGGLGARWISRRVTVPLREATEAAESIAQGDYARRLAVRSRNEVGRLGDAFNVMAERVEAAHAQLESRVAARTVDLQRAVEQLHEAQDELVRTRTLATLGQLAASVGHELRNPLGVMSNTVHVLDRLQAEAPPSVRDLLASLRRQIDLSKKITDDLLDFARSSPPQSCEVDVRQVVDEQIARLGDVGVGVVCEREIPCDLPRAFADPVQLGQILFNLLTNAVQAMDGRTDRRIVVAARVAAGMVRIAVRDSGDGVPDAVRDRIFEPLVTTRAHGIGLGLCISRRLARGLGGDLALEDGGAAGRGATFVVSVPIASASSAAVAAAATAGPRD